MDPPSDHQITDIITDPNWRGIPDSFLSPTWPLKNSFCWRGWWKLILLINKFLCEFLISSLIILIIRSILVVELGDKNWRSALLIKKFNFDRIRSRVEVSYHIAKYVLSIGIINKLQQNYHEIKICYIPLEPIPRLIDLWSDPNYSDLIWMVLEHSLQFTIHKKITIFGHL